jgi:hypothetical protein
MSLTPEAFIENHYIAGYAIAPGLFSSSRKANASWGGSQMLVLDIDEFPNGDGHEWTLDRLLSHPIIAKHAVAIVPSSSYTPETPKVHIYFPLDRMVTSTEDYHTVYTGLVNTLEAESDLPPLDMALRNPSQGVFGTRFTKMDATPAHDDGLHHLNENYEPLKVPLMLQRGVEAGADGSKGGKAYQHKHDHRETPDGLVEAILEAAGLKGGPNANGWYDGLTCPFHDHSKNPNTFGINAESGVGHCFAANGADEQASFSPYEMAAHFGLDMARFYTPTDPLSTIAETVNAKFLPTGIADDHATVAIKSAMGTGKTEIAGHVSRNTMADGGRVVAITHRISLAGEMAARLGLKDYRETTKEEFEEGVNVALCVNSIRKLKQGSGYPIVDTVIIDEVAQVLPHITGGTFSGDESSLCQHGFEQVVRRAKKVIVMDAHLSQFEVDWLNDLRNDVHVVVNTHKGNDVQWVKFHNAKMVEEAALRAAVATKGNGKPVMFAGGQRAVEVIAEQARELGLKALHINGGDGGNIDFPEIQDIVNNLNERLPEYDLVAYSPVLGSGVDITIPITALFGVMPGSVLTATEFAQLLGRCRKADVLNVYVPDTANGNRTTNADLIYEAGIAQAQASAVGMAWDGVNEIVPQDTMLHHKFVSKVTAKQNHALNWVGPAWSALYGEPMAQSKAGATEAHRDHSKIVRAALKDARIDAILKARPLTADEYSDLQAVGEVHSEEDQYAIKRYRIERATGYRINPVTAETYEGSLNGIYNAVNVFLVDDTLLQVHDLSQVMERYDLHHRDHILRKVKAVRTLLTGVWGDYRTVNLDPISKEHIDMVAAMWVGTGHADAFFGGVRRPPTRGSAIYKNVLKWIGLDAARQRIRNEEGDREVFYTLNDNTQMHLMFVQAGHVYRENEDAELMTLNGG